MSLESILASFATTIVGLLAQHVYGYKAKRLDNIDRDNAASLEKALYTTIGVPMAIFCFIYSFMYYAYPRDRDRARLDAGALIELESQLGMEITSVSKSGEYLIGLTDLDRSNEERLLSATDTAKL